jgi:tRNA wybutosine-synthesizing protein 1
MKEKKQLPTQLYVSMNASNKRLFHVWHHSNIKDAWEKYNQTLELLGGIEKETRTVLRMTLVKNKNMRLEHIKEYSSLIKKAKPLFVEVKGFMSVGFSRKRLGYETMPTMKEIKDYANHLAKETGMKILSSHEFSRIVLLGKSKSRMKIKKSEI